MKLSVDGVDDYKVYTSAIQSLSQSAVRNRLKLYMWTTLTRELNDVIDELKQIPSNERKTGGLCESLRIKTDEEFVNTIFPALHVNRQEIENNLKEIYNGESDKVIKSIYAGLHNLTKIV